MDGGTLYRTGCASGDPDLGSGSDEQSLHMFSVSQFTHL